MVSKKNTDNRANQLNPNNPAYLKSRVDFSKPVTGEVASTIQSIADKTGTNQDFKASVQSTTVKNKK